VRGEDMAGRGNPPAVMPAVQSAGDPIPGQYDLAVGGQHGGPPLDMHGGFGERTSGNADIALQANSTNCQECRGTAGNASTQSALVRREEGRSAGCGACFGAKNCCTLGLFVPKPSCRPICLRYIAPDLRTTVRQRPLASTVGRWRLHSIGYSLVGSWARVPDGRSVRLPGCKLLARPGTGRPRQVASGVCGRACEWLYVHVAVLIAVWRRRLSVRVLDARLWTHKR